MFFDERAQDSHTGCIAEICPVYPANILLFFAIVFGIAALPSASYGLDYQGTGSDSEAKMYGFSQDNTASRHFGTTCMHYIEDDDNFARNPGWRKRIAHGAAQDHRAGFVLGVSIALGPDSVRDGNADRLRFDIAGTDTLNGPVSGLAAYRDCRRRNILQDLQ